jgi:hypothetical protein
MSEDFTPSEQTLEQRLNDLESRFLTILTLFDKLAETCRTTFDSTEELREACQVLCANVTEMLKRMPKRD